MRPAGVRMYVNKSFLCALFTSYIFLYLSTTSSVNAQIEYESRDSSGSEAWAYVQVRPGAHMLYWLYQTHSVQGVTKAPLVLWLQGGPGGSSTGFGNFEEIGPLKVNLKPRNTTWLSEASLLFVDNPVGAGFSYVDSDDKYTTNVDEIASDLLVVLKNFFMNSSGGKQFQDVPFFIFSESYGGKMTAAISNVLYQAVQKKEINCNFKGLAMGDSWIHPVYSTVNWAPYLLVNSLIDELGYKNIQAEVTKMQDLIDRNLWKNATEQWSVVQTAIDTYTYGVNFYNILKWGQQENSYSRKPRNLIERASMKMMKPLQADALTELMNGPIKKKLKIIPDKVSWGAQSGMVFEKMSEDFMKPIVNTVDHLVQNTTLKVVVYSGQLDLIVETLGTEKWVESLQIFPSYMTAARKPVINSATNQPCAYVKTYKNFSFYWILDAGHMVPQDNGYAAIEMLRRVVSL